MRLPRDVSGDGLVNASKEFGYQVTRQTGNDIRLTAFERGEHHVIIPRHDPLRVGTLAGIVRGMAEHFQINRQEIISRLFR